MKLPAGLAIVVARGKTLSNKPVAAGENPTRPSAMGR
jgi:hypothetical protein